jgi:hypothetical protein
LTTIYGQAVTLTANVRANGSGTPTGSVDFFDTSSNTDLGSAGLDNVVARRTTTNLAAGSHLILATYRGDANFTFSIDFLTQTVTPVPPTIAAEDLSKVYGQTNPALSGHYTGFVNGNMPASLAVLPTLTTAATAFSDVGTYPINASAAADPNYKITYVGGTLTVLPAHTTTVLVSSANPAVFAQPATLTATVAALVPGAGTPTGDVTFLDGTVVLARVPLQGGSATFTTDSLARGTHALSVAYGGSLNFQPSTSAAVSQVLTTAALEPDPLDPAKKALFVGGTGGDDRIEID